MRKTILFIALILLATFASAESAQAWDFLRPFSNLAGDFGNITSIVVFLLSIGIAFISIKAYNRHKTERLLFVALAFVFFALKWAIKIIDLYVSPGYFLSDPAENVFELAILVSLFVAIFRK